MFRGSLPVSLLATLLLTSPARALSIDLNNMLFAPPDDPINVISVSIDTAEIGDDSDQSIVSGFVTSRVDLQLVGTTVQSTGLEFTGGQVDLSDASFSFLFGLLTATSSGLQGTPDTPLPPSPVTSGNFAADQHTILLNQGMIEAAGQGIDISADPVLVAGMGTGQVTITSNGPPVGDDHSFTATILFPVEFSQAFSIPDAPLVGTVSGAFSGQGTIQVSESFTLTINPGDYNLDGTLDCDDLMMLEQAIDTASLDLTFDANGDGIVDAGDELFWLGDLRNALAADANLDDIIDGLDFLAWNAARFRQSTGWCSGDLNHDGLTDGQDFVIWNKNKFTFQPARPGGTSVPAPTSLLSSLVVTLFGCTQIRNCRWPVG